MTLRPHHLLAATLGLWMASCLPGQDVSAGEEPGQAEPSANQRMADQIARHLRQSGLKNYSIDIAFQNGTAELYGQVASHAQRHEAGQVVRAVPGVEHVRDYLVLADSAPITQVQNTVQPLPEPKPLPDRVPATAPPVGTVQEPLPVFSAPPPSFYDVNTPRMPPHAWPTYAPYNNVSRVAYPEAYPYQAWPFIGPFYPFPKVPLGWRSVKLEWQDGHWWFSKVACKYDWWRIRYY